MLEEAKKELSNYFPEAVLKIQRISEFPPVCQTELLEREESFLLAWPDQIGFRIKANSNEITCIVGKGITIAEPYIDPCRIVVLASVLLGLENNIVIHGNTVAFDKDNAIAFVGPSGRGKSTLTSYCLKQQAKFLSDDLLITDENLNAISGFQRIKLTEKSARNLTIEQGNFKNGKFHFHSFKGNAFRSYTKAKLKTIYILEETKKNSVYSKEIPVVDALTILLSNGYFAPQLSIRNFKLFGRYINLANHVKVKYLFYPRKFQFLNYVYEFIREEVYSTGNDNNPLN